MAVFSFVAVPGGTDTSKTNVSGASSSEVSLGKNCIFMFVGDADMNIKFGLTGMGAADNADFLIPSKVPMAFDTGDQYTHIRVFGTGNFYVLKLTRN